MSDAPYGDFFESKQSAALNVKKQILEIGECEKCKLLQLMENPDLESLHKKYLYRSKLTVGLDHYYENHLDFITSRIRKKKKSAIDIGCNDGQFLNALIAKGFEVVGVDPAKELLPELCNFGFHFVPAFFNSELAEKILREIGEFTLVSANYTLANVTNVKDFLEGVVKIMDREGYFSIITGYHPDQFTLNMFDYISHDHISYFSLETIDKCLNQVGLSIVDSFRSELKGGSLHILAQKKKRQGKQNVSKRVNYIKQREEWLWQSNSYEILQLKNRIEEQKLNLMDKLNQIKEPMLGVGASVNTSYLVNEFNLGQIISYLVDDDSSKWGTYNPYYGIPVLPFSDKKVGDFKHAIILSWQHTNILINRLKQSDFCGELIVPLPKLRVLQI